ncbi:MAG: outer membrane protein assembly factor, partial [Rhodospirillales bacterium]|nr:outer membrane protein assembly factor [Acetobacter sp.]
MLGVLPEGRVHAQTPSSSQTVPAASQTTGGSATGQSGTNPTAPASVPQASQKPAPEAQQGTKVEPSSTAGQPVAPTVWQLKGLVVDSLQFQGVTFDNKERLPSELPQKAGQPLDPMAVRESTRLLFASGRYHDIAVRSVRSGDRVTLYFAGTPQYFVGRVTINGVKIERLSSLLEYATKLDPGTAFTDAEVPLAVQGIKDTLERNGYYQSTATATTQLDAPNQQVNVDFLVSIGPQARVGDIQITGNDPGLTEKDFRKKGKLKRKSKVTRETASNALDALRGVYQKKERLEGTVTLEKQAYDPNTKLLNYTFRANQGPAVKVSIEGVKVSKSRLKLLLPIFEEGTIDNDLLNEGRHNITDFMQQQGYFDADVKYQVINQGPNAESVVYTVDKGDRHKVLGVTIKGNKYFNDDTLRERIRVQKADLYVRNGKYSQALVTADVSSIEAIYRANGFNAVKVTSAVRDVDTGKNGKALKVGGVEVTYTVDEGSQQSFGSVTLSGVDASRGATIKGLINAQEGQPFSLITLSGDRDAV